MQLPRYRDFLTGFKIWGVPATVAVLGPLYYKIMSFRLISDYYQPGLTTATITIAAISCLAAYAFLLRKKLESITRALLASGIVCVLSFGFCLAMQQLDLSYWVDGRRTKDLMNLIHVICYILFFFCLSIVLICIFFSFPRTRDSKAKKDVTTTTDEQKAS